MLRPKFRLVRVLDETFSTDRLLKDTANRIRSNISDGRVLDDNLGFGFTVEMGTPKTLENYLFPSTTFTPAANRQQLEMLKGMMDAKL